MSKLSTNWKFYAITFDGTYTITPTFEIKTVEDFWNCIHAIPPLEDSWNCAIAFFKGEEKPSYDNYPTDEFIIKTKRDSQKFEEFLCKLIGGQFDKDFPDSGFRGTYIGFRDKDRSVFKVGLWFDPRKIINYVPPDASEERAEAPRDGPKQYNYICSELKEYFGFQDSARFVHNSH